MVIVETQKEWDGFLTKFKSESSVIVPVQCDDNKHPLATNLCLLYLRMLDDNTEEYILPFRHSDAINLKRKKLYQIKTSQKVYTYDKKKLLHLLHLDNIDDIQMKSYLDKNVPMPIDELTTNAHEHFNRVYWGKSNINCIIPKLKQGGVCT